MSDYDFCLGVSTYRSVGPALRFLYSLHYLRGKKIVVITGPNEEELTFLRDSYAPHRETEVIFVHTNINHLSMSRAWGYVYTLAGLKRTADYFIELDDDLEFIPESGEILDKLHHAPQFSLCAFDSSHPMHYPEYAFMDRDWKIGIPWIDGNFIVSNWYDTERCGVQDGLPDAPFSFYTETELGWRLSYLTGKPLICNALKQYYLHHFRETPLQRNLRQSQMSPGQLTGEMFFAEKFGVFDHFNRSTVHREMWSKIQPDLEAGNLWRLTRHLMWNGLFTDWDAIYHAYQDQFKVIGAL